MSDFQPLPGYGLDRKPTFDQEQLLMLRARVDEQQILIQNQQEILEAQAARIEDLADIVFSLHGLTHLLAEQWAEMLVGLKGSVVDLEQRESGPDRRV